MNAIELINKNKGAFFNIALILLSLFISSKIYKSQGKAIESLREQTLEESKKNEVLQDILSLEKKIGLYKDLLHKKDAASAISTLGNIAKESNINIISIKPYPAQELTDYIKIPFELSVNAPNYHSLGKFISRIENQQDVYVIDSLSINANNELKGLNVSLKVNTIALIK